MAHGTAHSPSMSSSWLTSLVEVVADAQKRGEVLSVEEMTTALASRMGGDPELVRAWISANEFVAEYAMAPLDDEEDAIFEEAAAITASRRAFRVLFEARMQRRVDNLDAATKGQATCPVCGRTASSHGRPARSWQSSLGSIRLSRRWSVCSDSQHSEGRALAQEKLLLPKGPYTAPLEEAITLMATTVPFGMATQLLGQMLGVEVSEHAVQDAVEQRGEALTKLQEKEVEDLAPYEENGLERQVDRPDDAVSEPPEVAYVEIDGVFPMTREKDEERSNPVDGARGGKGLRYNLVGKEVKNAVLYTADACAQETQSRGCILEKRYVSRLGSKAPFALMLWGQMLRLRFDQAKKLVFLSDGAEWIRNIAEWLPIPVLSILDLYHAMHRIWEVGRAVYGDKTPECARWAKEQCHRIENGDVDLVLQGLHFLLRTPGSGQDKVQELITYFENNRDRMDYPAYRAQGLRITSGTVESANYHVTGARLKLQGMRWSERGAAHMARLRADLFNGSWQRRTRQILAA